MKKVMLVAVIFVMSLTGCAVQETSEDHVTFMEVVEAVVTYQLIYGTAEERENMKPITDEEVAKLVEYMEGIDIND